MISITTSASRCGADVEHNTRRAHKKDQCSASIQLEALLREQYERSRPLRAWGCTERMPPTGVLESALGDSMRDTSGFWHQQKPRSAEDTAESDRAAEMTRKLSAQLSDEYTDGVVGGSGHSWKLFSDTGLGVC